MDLDYHARILMGGILTALYLSEKSNIVIYNHSLEEYTTIDEAEMWASAKRNRILNTKVNFAGQKSQLKLLLKRLNELIVNPA